MKKIIYFFVAASLFLSACTNPKPSEKDMKDNVLITTFTTPFGVPPFDQISLEDYKQAFDAGIELQNNEIEAIASNPEAPNFKNTIEKLENSGKLLERTETIFFNLLSANTNKEMQQLAQEIAPKLSAHGDNILMNEQLFKRIQSVYQVKDRLELSQEQQRLLEETYTDFVRGGAELSEADKTKLKEINEKLSVLSLQFSENVLDENNNFELIIENKDDLTGLPESVISAASEAATEKGKPGKWVFTLDQPSRVPFLQFADNRDLREKILKGYINRGDNNNEYDNKEIVMQIVNLRIEKAKLLGFESYADFVLAKTMAKTPEKVYDLMNQLMVPGLEMAKKERKALQDLADAEGAGITIEAWDWWYYTEKLRKMNYDLDEEQMRPYFQLENVRDGVFYVSNQLFGLNFIPNDSIPVYHPDVEAYEVTD
ncbi:MAG TPA: M3 family metallopeptidase, partial [Bacteroidales bacterium]